MLEKYINFFTTLKIYISSHIVLLLQLSIILILLLIAFRHFLKRYHLHSKENSKENSKEPSKTIITSQDIRAIAGEDVMMTQLDLARAYIELRKVQLAKQILQHVMDHGDGPHKFAAQQLLMTL